MSSNKGFCDYTVPPKANVLPGKRSVAVNLKCGINFSLDVPNFGPLGTSEGQQPCGLDTSKVIANHLAFRARIYLDEAQDDRFFEKCVGEVDAISTFFPFIRSEGLYTCFAAWLSFACAMDDILETLKPKMREDILLECVAIIQEMCTNSSKRSRLTEALSFLRRTLKGSANSTTRRSSDTRIQALTRILLDHCQQHLTEASARAFFKAVAVVLRAHVDEARFLRSVIPANFENYIKFRCKTISLNPFFEVIKCEYLDDSWRSIAIWDKLQLDVSRAAGLQNDLIGLERDLMDGEQLNAVIVLLRASGVESSRADNAPLSHHANFVADEHNKSVALSLDSMGEICLAASSAPRETFIAVVSVARHILLLADTHLKWCSAAKRYQIKVAPQLTTPRTPSPSSDSQLVRSVDIYHGLPLYPDNPEREGLTALVAGGTGLSGYHMVRVLVSSRRWKKVVCLSSRSPPANFFADLGDDADHVEHLAVDLLAEPSEIARRVAEKLSTVDSVFYFSYLQPAPKGNVLDLWANADELATVNVTMFANFIAALKQTTLTPRRFLLQTGTKHYGFYLGPAPLPAFETDPRVTMGRNFYYEQEDALHAYCKSVGAAWGVARPSYIIGAVPDGSLNHLVGFGIYAAVQAHLEQPIRFPGDFSAWDREQVQSTAMMNAYFEEWMVLSDKTANQAFNIHDGLSFTWGRLWPNLARWYKVDWTPPELEEDKYRVMTLPYATTPRGYGPQATFRSTGSLLEWSLQPEVESAWKELAQKHGLALDPFTDRYRARVFSFSDSAVIGNAPMTSSVRKARQFGFHGTVDSYHSIFNTLHELALMKLIPRPALEEFECDC